MSAVNRFSLAACAALLCGQLAGCATGLPASEQPAVTGSAAGMSQAQMERLAVEAEQALAANALTEAGERYVRIVNAYPNSAPAWFRLGTIYLRTNQLEAAQMAFERSLVADPGLTKANANLALVHLRQFRKAATRAMASPQVAAANKEALRVLLAEVEHTLEPAEPFVPTPAPVAAQ